MVSQKQRVARKRFRDANPDLVQKPPSPKDPSLKRQKKKERLKKRKALIRKKIERRNGAALKTKKHPLRVPGMRPGEGCFICKSKDHIAKLCPEKANWEKNKICLLCRQHGHSLKNCPDKKETTEQKFCYNCGEGGHSLSKCPQPIQDGGAKYACCFICNDRGHLSKNCPKNTHGIYPKGGSCKICGQVTHLVKDCPKKAEKQSFTSFRIDITSNNHAKDQQNNVVRSGDDLEDDFAGDDLQGGKKEPGSVNMKRKHGPKVVNFHG
ncbi:Cold shock protein 1 [Apostasia shenzhenica]|uniref:Cold shock protein 1 n=1 Tax=Apostasia shenzhenica TaxID=1088818 RepID=A0A2I0AHK2_9ASPA|nr:Cold shock protein 1 [Apostasia shenzhenica]